MMIATLLMLADATGTAAAAAPAPAAAAEEDDSKIRCVRQEMIGSLVRTRKVCKTMAEWKIIWADSRQEAERLSQPGTSNPAS